MVESPLERGGPRDVALDREDPSRSRRSRPTTPSTCEALMRGDASCLSLLHSSRVPAGGAACGDVARQVNGSLVQSRLQEEHLAMRDRCGGRAPSARERHLLRARVRLLTAPSGGTVVCLVVSRVWWARITACACGSKVGTGASFGSRPRLPSRIVAIYHPQIPTAMRGREVSLTPVAPLSFCVVESAKLGCPEWSTAATECALLAPFRQCASGEGLHGTASESRGRACIARVCSTVEPISTCGWRGGVPTPDAPSAPLQAQ